jgi:hypothetical protein
MFEGSYGPTAFASGLVAAERLIHQYLVKGFSLKTKTTTFMHGMFEELPLNRA